MMMILEVGPFLDKRPRCGREDHNEERGNEGCWLWGSQEECHSLGSRGNPLPRV